MPTKLTDFVRDLGDIIVAKAINGAAATATVGMEGCNSLELWITYTNSAATDVIVTITASEDGTNFFSPQSLDGPTSGDYAASNMTITKAVSASGKFLEQIYPISSSANFVKIVITGTSADANDLVSVRASRCRV